MARPSRPAASGRSSRASARRPAAARRARRALAERAARRVERPELAQVLVRLLEMPADRLVVLGRVADLRLDPVGEARRAARRACP